MVSNFSFFFFFFLSTTMTSQPNDLTSLKTVLYDAQSTTDTDSSVYYSLDSSHDLKRPAETSESPPPAKMDTLEKARKEFRITPPDWKNHMGAWAYLQSLAPQHRSMYLEKTQTDQRQRKGYMLGRAASCDIV